jgi:hypothetical protein
MADSPAFNPPGLVPKDTDPMVSKVSMKTVEYGNRESQQPVMNHDGVGPISRIPNGR